MGALWTPNKHTISSFRTDLTRADDFDLSPAFLWSLQDVDYWKGEETGPQWGQTKQITAVLWKKKCFYELRVHYQLAKVLR